MPKLAFILFGLLFSFSQPSWSDIYNDIITNQPIPVQEFIEKKKVALVFMNTDCPCIKNALDNLKEQIVKHSTEFQFIGISVQKNNSRDAKDIFKIWNLNIPIVLDAHGKLLKEWQVSSVGTVVVLNKNKMLYRGGIQLENGSPLLSKALDEINAENKTDIKNDQGLGCIIDL